MITENIIVHISHPIESFPLGPRDMGPPQAGPNSRVQTIRTLEISSNYIDPPLSQKSWVTWQGESATTLVN